ncbi:MAG: hypothetical protein C7B45_12750 [Sulfobacillus acidophilus]|uniref:YkuS family protein n=1 Tax=Sulfobacillus acidophilus TaxID=53633 RepID=A0A2T2WFF4_9FIRM|nr:MAG: hypothetical protein C7B45_12750 [Sulfobacillus acidophilus]
MSDATVALEAGLTSYRHTLEKAGYHVIALDEQALGVAQAIVVQGLDNQFLGIADPQSLAPVINADGMTPNEVLHAVKNRAILRS